MARAGKPSELRLETNGLISIESANVTATNVLMTGVKARQSDGWHARVDIDRGTLAPDETNEIGLDLHLQLLDTRPLLALLREEEDSPRWLRLLPTLKNLSGGNKPKIGPTNLVIRDFHLRGAATGVLGQLSLTGGLPDGILYARYGLISGGLDFRDGESEWTMFGARPEVPPRACGAASRGGRTPRRRRRPGIAHPPPELPCLPQPQCFGSS